MANMSTTFYSTHEELRDFFVAQIKEFRLHTFVNRWSSLKPKYFPPEEADKVFLVEKTSSVNFTHHAPAIEIKNLNDLSYHYDSRLSFDYPKLGPDEYKYIHFGSRQGEDKIWQKINRRLKKITKAGVFTADEARSYINNLRYTKGAKKAFDMGAKFQYSPNTWVILPDFPE